MSRQQARLLHQRRRPSRLRQEAEARSALDRQWRVKLRRETQVSKWWNYGDEDGATKPVITYSNLNCNRSGVVDVEQAKTSAYGYPYPSTSSSSLAVELWKTLKGRKACNRYGVPVPQATNTAADLTWRTPRAANGTTGGGDERGEKLPNP
ncbi:hypothetical protein PR003_g25372, partial [Phytophthora rubi]